MILLTITQTVLLPQFFNLQPFIFVSTPSSYALPSFWTTAFGAPDDSMSETINITQIVQDYLVNYSELDSLADVQVQQGSFYWDSAAQALYVHVYHGSSPDTSIIQKGQSHGFCDTKLIYVDGILFSPLVKSVPAIAQSQDFLGYDKLTFVNGKIVLNNVGGDLDYLIDTPIYGSDVNLFYLAEVAGIDDYSFEDIVRIAAFYVEDYAMSMREISLNVQDKRKAGENKFPTETFTVSAYPYLADSFQNQVIPLAFGTIRISKAIPVNSDTTGNVTFRQAQVLTDLGTVQVKIADEWVEKTAVSEDLATGSFVLAESDARNGGTVYECRVLGSEGIAITSAVEVIEYINENYLDLPFNASNYVLDEWAIATASIDEIGILFNKEVEIYEAIRQIQNGCSVGFRYEISPDGKRTIRIDDSTRAESFTIHNEDILDIEDLQFETDRSLLAASVKVNYAKDFNQGESLVARSIENYDYVKETYRLIPELEFDTFLPNSTLANARATLEANKYMDVPRFLTITARGEQFLGLRIYDTGTAEITSGFVNLDTDEVVSDRPWLGVWKVQVLSVAPDLMSIENRVKLALITKKF